MSYDVGDIATLTITFTDPISGVPVDPDTVTLEVRAPDGTDITPGPTKTSTGVYTASVLVNQAGTWTYLWVGTGDHQASEPGSLYVKSTALDTIARFASVEDVAVRVGRQLTADETTQVRLLLDLATGLITEAVGKTDTWANGLSPIPAVLRSIAIEAAIRVMRNPAGVDSQTETLGAYSHTERYATATAESAGLMLTDTEERRARRAVYGSNIASTQIGSIIRDDISTLP